ncbi:MAG: DUF362 domain-containing protein [Methanoregula sp.]
MSYFLDPPALFLFGIIVYYLSKRLRWELLVTGIVMIIISVVMFMGGSSLLYLDIIAWPFPPTPGSVWMFHTNYTGITKESVPVIWAVVMFFLYPVWQLCGYLLALRFDTGSFLLRMVSYNNVRSRRARGKTVFSVTRGPDAREITRAAVERTGGLGRFVQKGNRVVIKVNISGGNPQIPGSFTSIAVADELVGMIQEAGGEPVVVDSDMIWTKFAPVAEAEGWVAWAQERNVPLVNLRETEQVRFNFKKGSAIGIVPVSKILVDADVIISVPTMKTHLLTGVTLGMKNMYGTFPEENKAKFHRFGIEDVVCEVNAAFTPNLTVIDGTTGGEAWGPLSCSPVGFQTVIAANDVVAADAIACRLMGYDPSAILHIKKAHDKGLGDAMIAFDISALSPPHRKDGVWEKPDPGVSRFYEALIETALLLPGMQKFFDLAADFVLFGFATLPILKDITPAMERILNDILMSLFASGYRGSKWKDVDTKKFQASMEKFSKEMMMK